MDLELVKRASETDLSKDEYRCLMQVVLGARTPFDIQKPLGWKLARCEAVWESVQGKIFPPITKVIVVNNKTTVRSTGVKNLPSLTTELISLVAVPNVPRNRKGVQVALNAAIKQTGETASGADLLAWYIRTHTDVFAKATYPALYLPTVFAAYLRTMPKKTREQLEFEKLSGRVQYWNDKLRKWEYA